MGNEGKTIITDINRVILTGSIGKDAELKYTTNGAPVVRMRMCANKTVKGQNAGYWATCIGFGKLAESLGAWGRKGRRILVEGYLKSRSYEHVETVKLVNGGTAEAIIERQVTETIVTSFHFMDSKPTSANNDDDAGDEGDEVPADKAAGTDEIPF